jgi:colicin import membrane protein
VTGNSAAFRPEAADGLGVGAVLALLAHVLLVAALAFGVSWKTHNEAVIEAEVWSEVPQAAAPQAVPPPPAEPVPEVPKEAPQEVAQAEPEVETPVAEIPRAPPPVPKVKPKPKKEPKPKKIREPVEAVVKAPPVVVKKPAPVVAPPNPAVSNAVREAQRKANLQRMMSDLGGLGQSSHSTGKPSASYAGRLISRIFPNIVFNGTISGDATAWVEIHCAPDGRILSRRLLESSGSPEWDNAVLRGIDKTEFLPMDENGRLPDTVQQLGIKPKDR